MKKYFFLILLLMIGYITTSTAQPRRVSGTRTSCNYSDFLSIRQFGGFSPTGNSLEISYSSKDKMYGIDFTLGYKRVMITCRFDKQLIDGRYKYKGIEINSMKAAQIITETELSEFLKYYGQEQIEIYWTTIENF